MIIILQTTVDAAGSIRPSQSDSTPKTPLNSISLHNVVLLAIRRSNMLIGRWRLVD